MHKLKSSHSDQQFIEIAPSKKKKEALSKWLPRKYIIKNDPSKKLSRYLVLIYSSSESLEDVFRSSVIYLTALFLFQYIYILLETLLNKSLF